MGDEWLSATEAAARLGVSVRQVQRLAKQGKLNHRTEDRKMQIAAADVAMRQSRDSPRPAPPTEIITSSDALDLISRQQQQLLTLARHLGQVEGERDLLSRRVRDLEATLAYARRPWWRRLFGKRRDLEPRIDDHSRDVESPPNDQSRDRRDVEL